MLKKMEVKIKKLSPAAVIPFYATEGAAGMDMTAISYSYDKVHGYHEYKTGIAMEIPKGYVGLVFPRSSNSKTNAYLCNSVGIIDSDYRGDISFRFKNRTATDHTPPYRVGKVIGQIIILPYPIIKFIQVEELSETKRGTGGYGSTGN